MTPRAAASAKTSKNRPAYAITSVDHALELAAILQLEGRITVSEAAERLDVAPSTAHRLLSMLVYRDFATHEGRSYRVGPVLGLSSPHSHSSTAQMRAAALPQLQALVEQFDESANLLILTDATVRFIASVEADHPLRVGNRAGMSFPAHRTSGGLALLAEMTDAAIASLYEEASGQGDEEAVHVGQVMERVRGVREQGFCLNTGWSERDVLAAGLVVRDATGAPAGALSVSMRSTRFSPVLLRPLVGALRQSARAIQATLASAA